MQRKPNSVLRSQTSENENNEIIEVIVTQDDWKNALEDIEDVIENDSEDKDNGKEVEKYFCSDCSKMFESKNKLSVHRISIHHDDLVTETVKIDSTENKVTGLWTCDVCGAKFRSRTSISTHIRCQHLSTQKEPTAYFKKLVFCKYCGSSFSRANINRHLEIVHRLTKNPELDQSDFGSFDCRICFRPFMRHSSLRNHIEKYHGDSLEMIAEAENCEIIWTCNECDLLFSEEMYLMQHYGRKHSKYPLDVDSLRVLKSKDLICDCGAISLNNFDLAIHNVFYHSDQKKRKAERMDCPACETTFPQLLGLKKHLISHHWFVATGFENDCTFCGKEFETNDLLRVHLHEKHDIDFDESPSEEKPAKDKKKSKDSKILKDTKDAKDIKVIKAVKNTTDMKEEEKSQPTDSLEAVVKLEAETSVEVLEEQPKFSVLFCESCGGYFGSEDDLQNHQENCTSLRACNLCGKSYKSDNHLRRHVVEYHNTLSPIKCPLCPKVFPRKMNLHNHYKRRHLKQTKKFVCSFCGQSLKGKVALRSHEDRLHRNIRNFKCPDCPEAFTTRNILRKHSQRHMAERPMLHCQYCERKFSTISGIERHIKKHEGVKDFVCDLALCGKSFYTQSELKRHIKFHNRDFKHVCPVCNHKFMSPGELKKHSTKHTGERPYKCHLCECAYARRDDKVKHLKRVHDLKVKRIYGKPLRKYSDREPDPVDTIVINDSRVKEEVMLTEDVDIVPMSK